MSQEDICKEHYKGFFKTSKRVLGEVGAVFVGIKDFIRDYFYVVGHLGESKFKTKNYDFLARSHLKYLNESENLYFESLHLGDDIKEQQEKINTQGDTIVRLTTEKNELNNEIRGLEEQLIDYKRGVLESSEYKSLMADKEEIEGERNTLSSRVNELNQICELRKGTISRLRGHINKFNDSCINTVENMIKNRAEGCDKELSYIVAHENRVVASTPEFRDKFDYEETDVKYSWILRAPEGDSESHINLKEFSESQEPRSLEVTILDGKGKERVVVLEKHFPETVGILDVRDDELIRDRNYSYYRIDVHDIGIIKKVSYGIQKIYNWRRQPETTQEFKEKKKLEELSSEKEKFKEIGIVISRLSSKGLNEKDMMKIWDKYKEPKKCRDRYTRLLKHARREKNKKRKIRKREIREEKTN